METAKDKIKLVIDRLGMSGSIAANAMGISYSAYQKKIMPSSSSSNTFSDKNYNDLVDFLVDEIKFILSYKENNDNTLSEFQSVVDKVNDLFDNFKEYSKVDDWILFDELKNIINEMEIINAFSNNDLYSKIVYDIELKCIDLKNEYHEFTIVKFNDYALRDKKLKHYRWFNFMDEKRRKAIMDILRD